MSAEAAHAPALLRWVTAHQETVTSNLRQALRGAAFANTKLIPPRRLDRIGEEEMAAFLTFLERADEKEANERGRQLAADGLGHRSVLEMTEALRHACRESVDHGGQGAAARHAMEWRGIEQHTGRYACALLEGYMAGREEDLLREQERTREAYLRARERQIGNTGNG